MFVVGHVTLQRWHEIERAARANKRTMSDEIAERLEILAAWSELLKAREIDFQDPRIEPEALYPKGQSA